MSGRDSAASSFRQPSRSRRGPARGGRGGVASSLREAAMLDGSNEWQVFRRVVFPSLKPINVVIAVITVIEALRAFDIIFVLNVPRKTEVLSILTTNNLLGEGGGNVGDRKSGSA